MLQLRSIIQRMPLAICCLLFVGLVAVWGMPSPAQADDPKGKDPIQAGYAVVTPSADGLLVFETFGEHRGNEMTQAGVLPSELTTRAVLFVNANGRLSRNLGVAMANPDPANAASVTLTLRSDDGSTVATTVVPVPKGTQVAKFVTELFANQPAVPQDFTGTLEVDSNIAIAVMGLRFRGQNFSTLPVRNLSGVHAVPTVSAGVGGANAVILAQFAIGGGWATEIIIANTSTTALTVRVDLFSNAGLPLTATLNGQSASSFTNITVPPMGVFILAPRDANGDSDF